MTSEQVVCISSGAKHNPSTPEHTPSTPYDIPPMPQTPYPPNPLPARFTIGHQNMRMDLQDRAIRSLFIAQGFDVPDFFCEPAVGEDEPADSDDDAEE